MRFAEFKIINEFAPSNSNNTETATGFYTIGDSHAAGIARAGGKPWVDLAVGGRQSNDKDVRANVSQIPKGSIVLVSAGANDTANAAKAAAEQQRTPISAGTIADRVASLIDIVKSRDPKGIVFLLFPNGPARTQGIERWYGGDYQDAVRKAIKAKLDVPIIDLDGEPLADGVHATWPVYSRIAKEVASGKISTSTAGQGAQPVNAGPLVKIETPKGVRGPEIADIQKVIKAEGYGELLGKFGNGDGIDGIRGKYTTNAIATWQKANKLEDTSGIPGEETIAKMNELLSTKYKDKLTKSTEADVVVGQPGADGYTPMAGPGLGETGSAKEAVQFFISNGWTPAQAAGIVGNLQAESGAHLRTNAVGDGGIAYGIAQWHPDRQAKFKRAYGKDIRQAGFKEQLAFVQWELDNSETNAAAELKKAKTPQQAAAAFDQYYERSSGAHRSQRIANASALMPTSSTAIA